MTPTRFEEITARYDALRIAVVGDFCLDRYLEIDPARGEVSIETGLPVHNVVRVRHQPGAAGTILANLAALGVGNLHPVGFCGMDGEGFELQRALVAIPGVRMRNSFVSAGNVSTFTYTKPLLCESGKAPVELSRLDQKNWHSTPEALDRAMAGAVLKLAPSVDGIVVMDQVPLNGTGVVTKRVRAALQEIAGSFASLTILADSRRTLREFPPVIWKMNASELAALGFGGVSDEAAAVSEIARQNGRPAFATLAERGIVGAVPGSPAEHVPSFPVHGPIDIVGAGDAVTANLAAALAAGATLREAMELAMAAASVVIHQLGTTGTASLPQLRRLVISDFANVE